MLEKVCLTVGRNFTVRHVSTDCHKHVCDYVSDLEELSLDHHRLVFQHVPSSILNIKNLNKTLWFVHQPTVRLLVDHEPLAQPAALQSFLFLLTLNMTR